MVLLLVWRIFSRSVLMAAEVEMVLFLLYPVYVIGCVTLSSYSMVKSKVILMSQIEFWSTFMYRLGICDSRYESGYKFTFSCPP